MSALRHLRTHPRRLAIACAVGATAAGIVYLTVAGAPPSYIAINIGALAIGLAAAKVLALLQSGPAQGRAAGWAALALATALLTTTLFGTSVEGAARWTRVGALFVQPSLLIVPLLVVIHGRRRGPASATAVLVAALALALQPDRAMAGALAVGAGTVALARPDRSALAALAGASVAFAATLTRADALAAVPYVDGILYSSIGVGPIAALAVLGGAMLLLAPSPIGALADAANRHVHFAFGAVWFAIIAAAAMGNYPTPVVGYGGSAIIGYLLSLALLPRRIGGEQEASRATDDRVEVESDRLLPMQVAH